MRNTLHKYNTALLGASLTRGRARGMACGSHQITAFASPANIVRRAEVVPLSKREPKESQGTHTIGAQRIKHLTMPAM